MIPGSFSYHRPATVADAVKLLSTLGEEARPLAGGHSLVPMMKLRLATPEHLVDLHGIAGLKGVRRDGSRIVIGAMTTQHELLASDEIGKSLPILHETALLIADPQVRYMGTIGGNVANGDPGNDMPALMMTLGASYRLEGATGGRDIAASEFYQGAYFTALEPGRCGGPYLGRRQGCQLRDRPHQSARNPAAGGRRRQGRDRDQPRRHNAQESRGGGGSNHVTGRRCPRADRIPQTCRRHHGDAGAATCCGSRKLGRDKKWQRPM